MQHNFNDIVFVKELLARVNDPELPVLSIIDLGILRDVIYHDDKFEIIITPTYSGCPAMDMIGMEIRAILLQHSISNFKINTVLSPAWTTEWMTESGKQKLKAYGVAPPTHVQSVCSPALFHQQEAIQCPACDAFNTTLISQFGSTACKALYKCDECLEVFDYFKCH